ncbi:DUF1902 domain-containing protein [Orbus mooreae]|uniref:DUF1902 domain-containing protein n=1 Tax=Orbus mooreae TaxID=3074107 RepID=UPI00370DC888
MSKVKVLRCMLFRKNGLYIAACLDLTLAAQANTPLEAKNKLDSQVKDYLQEALEDECYAYDLLNRKAPFSWWVRYYSMFAVIKFISIFRQKSGKSPEIFEQQSNNYCH